MANGNAFRYSKKAKYWAIRKEAYIKNNQHIFATKKMEKIINNSEYIRTHYPNIEYTTKEIARHCGMKERSVYSIAYKLGVKKDTLAPPIEGEEWKSLQHLNLGQYLISSAGRIRNIEGKYLRTAPHHQSGYTQVRLVDDDNKKVTVLMHRLVALTFLGEPPQGMEVDHIDRDRTNAALLNLRYVTRSENVARQKVAKRTRLLTEEEVHEICRLLVEGYSYSQIKEYNSFYTKSKVEGIRQRKRWCNIGKDYTW